MEVDVSFRVGETRRATGTVRKLWKNEGLRVEAKMLHEGVAVPMALYGAETWGLREAERRKLDIFEIGCLRSIYGETLWNRVRHKEVRRRAQVERHLSSRGDQCVLRWSGHVERMDEECVTKKVMISDVERNRRRGRPRLGWLGSVRMASGERGMSVEQGGQNALDRRRRELIVRSE